MHRRRPIGHLRHEILVLKKYARIKHKLFIVSIMKMKTFLKKSVNTNQEIIKKFLRSGSKVIKAFRRWQVEMIKLSQMQ
ncbi:hypothetical protein P8452_16552 [Trifolium repens]|nr:hypothetical protein P8452_16552 [Trifolium repens]